MLSFLRQLRSRIDRWRLCLLCFVMVYAGLLLIDLAFKSMLWDEGAHFIGGLLLSRGQLERWVWTNSFYPPVFDLFTAAYFIVGGSASVFAGRLVGLTFSVLSIFMIYELANKMYGAKTALVSAVLFGVMPGIVWVSRMAMIESMLIFVFTLVMFFFFRWLQTNRERDRMIYTVAIAVGVAVKYQMLVLAPVIVLLCLFFWKRAYLKNELASFFKRPRVILTIVAATIVVVVVSAILISGLLSPWFYAIQVGTADKAVYSVRFPMPIYYFIEMPWPADNVHPISLLLYLADLAGLALFALRRKKQDKFLLLWFAVVYLVFTAIPNREWRYVTVLFPVLAISGASVIVAAYDKLQNVWRAAKSSLPRRRLAKFAAAMIIVFTVVGIAYSCFNAYSWVAEDHIQVPVEQATNYAAQSLNQNQSLMVACPLNYFNKQMVWFYLNAKVAHQNNVSQYPELAVDAYSPNFNVTEFIDLCEQNSTQYVLLYENKATKTYFNSTLTEQQVYGMLIGSGRFELQASVGTEPDRIFILKFK
jgi:4-amino-4-deoxy-L-arabinose transferase-like glycosyltransferase